MEQPDHIIVMGVAGSGKTSTAILLGRRLGRQVAEGDDFHPPANIRKMTDGIPLQDADRWEWLGDIKRWLSDRTERGESSVITCSALKRAYRDVLRLAPGRVRFLHLSGDQDLVTRRATDRSGHFMPASLLPSQFETLEPLGADEDGVTVSIENSTEEIVNEAIALLLTGKVLSDPKINDSTLRL